MYKKHWKTPYRESPYNIRPKERKITPEENEEVYVSSLPEFDPTDYNDRLVMREMMPSYDGVKLLNEQDSMSADERRAELWESFESLPKIGQAMAHSYAPYHFNLEDEYTPNHFNWRERGATGFEHDSVMREIFVDLEQFIEEVIGKDRIQTKQLDMYKGTVKKWQVLDDAAFSREEVTKMQAAVRAPLPEELEMYKERHSKPMTLPPTNENVSKWRDAESVTETGADFDPQFLEYDRERRKKFFMERYEKPKELAE